MQLSTKTRLLNVFRAAGKIPLVERFLASRTRGRTTAHFWSKLLPNPYQYRAPAWRRFTRNGLTLEVDITDYMGYVHYFGLNTESYGQLFRLCREGDYVVDVGANVGWTVLNLARISRTGRVIGFEPDPYNLRECQKNLTLNNVTNVLLLPHGLGQVAHAARIEMRAVENRGGNRIAPAAGAADGAVVDVKRLDDVAEVNALPRVSLIKIDVEGYELKVLKGGAEILRRHKPVLFVEIDDHNLRDQGDSPSSVLAFLRGLGYGSLAYAETGASIGAGADLAGCHFDLVARP